MKTSNTRKRRLEVLAAQQSSRRPPAQGHTQGLRTAGVPAAKPSAPSNIGQPAAASVDEQGGPPQFPYLPLESSSVSTAHVAAKLRLPAVAAFKGNLEDALEALMLPHMPLPVAQSMIASRTAADKAVVLVHPTGRINLARPSSSSKGQRQLLSAKLLPRAKRAQLCALPGAGIDYTAMLSLHDLWCKYASGVLANAAPGTLDRFLQSLDWHGALLRVVSSKNPIYVHRAGIVAKATSNTFVLVSDDGRSSIIPLKGSSFECSIDCGRVVDVILEGDNLKSLKCAEKAA